jgi:DUF4097 and DUF4098 domain-containing protein YvlB
MRAAAEERAQATRVECRPLEGGHELIVEVPEQRRWRGGLVSPGLPVRVVVEAPPDSAVRVATASADVELEGPLGDIQVETASGDVTFQEVRGSAALRTASGDIHGGRAGGPVSAHTASGGVHLEAAAGTVDISTASGDQWVGVAGGRARLRTVSGDIHVGRAEDGLEAETVSGDIIVERTRGQCSVGSVSGEVDLRCVADGRTVLHSVSGDLSVGVPRGTWVRLDLETKTGDLVSDIDVHAEAEPPGAGPGVDLVASTQSGDVRIRRTEATA